MNDAAGVAQGVRREFDTPVPHPGRAHAARPRRGVSARNSRRSRRWPGSPARRTEALKARMAALEPSSPPARDRARRCYRQARRRARGPDRLTENGPELLSIPAVFAISRAVRGAQHPWRHAATERRPRQRPFSIQKLEQGLDQWRPSRDQGDGASGRRQGGRPGRASRRPCAGRDLRRQQTPRHHLARPCRAAAAHLCGPFPHHDLSTSTSTAPSTASSRATSSSIP